MWEHSTFKYFINDKEPFSICSILVIKTVFFYCPNLIFNRGYRNVYLDFTLPIYCQSDTNKDSPLSPTPYFLHTIKYLWYTITLIQLCKMYSWYFILVLRHTNCLWWKKFLIIWVHSFSPYILVCRAGVC